MKTPAEVPGLSCSQGKPITTISAAWSPVNNMTHKLIMPLSLLPPFPPCCLPLHLSHDCHLSCVVSCSLSICGSLTPIRITLGRQQGWADAWSVFWSGGLAWRILGEMTENDAQQCSALTSKQLQLYTFWSRLRAPCQVPWRRAFGICFVVRRVRDSSTMAGVKQRREMRVAGPAVWENSANCENTVSASLVENMDHRNRVNCEIIKLSQQA